MTREQKIAKRKEAGKTYQYQPNPYKKGTKQWHIERMNRAEKNKSHKTDVALWRSIMAKLDNELKKNAEESKKRLAEDTAIK